MTLKNKKKRDGRRRSKGEYNDHHKKEQAEICCLFVPSFLKREIIHNVIKLIWLLFLIYLFFTTLSLSWKHSLETILFNNTMRWPFNRKFFKWEREKESRFMFVTRFHIIIILCVDFRFYFQFLCVCECWQCSLLIVSSIKLSESLVSRPFTCALSTGKYRKIILSKLFFFELKIQSHYDESEEVMQFCGAGIIRRLSHLTVSRTKLHLSLTRCSEHTLQNRARCLS